MRVIAVTAVRKWRQIPAGDGGPGASGGGGGAGGRPLGTCSTDLIATTCHK